MVPMGVLGLNLAYGLDGVSAFLVGLSCGSHFIQDVEAREEWLTAYRNSHPNKYMFWLLETPGLVSLLTRLKIGLIPRWVTDAHHYLEEWASRIIDKAEKLSGSSGSDSPLVYDKLKVALDREQAESRHLPPSAPSYFEQRRLELASEFLDQMGTLLGCF